MKNLLLAIILSTITFGLFSQAGKIKDDLSLTSKILKMDRKYAVYLPPDYETSQRSYPVLYLLHGAGDDQTGWVQFGEVLRITDEAVKSGIATPMIIVMPDANTGKRGYVNDVKGEWRYEDYQWEEKALSYMPFIIPNYFPLPVRSAQQQVLKALLTLRFTDYGRELKALQMLTKKLTSNDTVY
jgi:S-formylglutathione hydrolase FrmB